MSRTLSLSINVHISVNDFVSVCDLVYYDIDILIDILADITLADITLADFCILDFFTVGHDFVSVKVSCP